MLPQTGSDEFVLTELGCAENEMFVFFRATLNVCFAYTAREDICQAMQEAVEGVQLGLIRERYIEKSESRFSFPHSSCSRDD